ncbi:hypothetical protein [Actinophytocola sp.]|uniref:hypothetical protein n=1 Tax=Actinophytocola sp. TaxID=1872138 RepID=UPI003D6B06D0
MNEQDLRDGKRLLGRALGDEPPLWMARDEVLRRGRRVVRRRRLAISGGVATGVVAVLVGAVALTSLAGPNGSSGAPAGAAVPAPPPVSHSEVTTTPAVPVLPSKGGVAPGFPVPGADIPRPGEPRTEAEAKRLAGLLSARPPRLPEDISVQPIGMSVVDGGWHVIYDLETTDSDRSLLIDVWPTETRGELNCTGAQSGEQMSGCATKKLENGASIRTLTEGPPDGSTPTLRSVVASRPDGTSVFVLETGTSIPTSIQPLLTFDQLTELALMPQLRVRW